jgi:hypothetical protein
MLVVGGLCELEANCKPPAIETLVICPPAGALSVNVPPFWLTFAVDVAAPGDKAIVAFVPAATALAAGSAGAAWFAP